MTIRRCPRCTFTLATLPVQGVTLDACPRCRGVFVDRAEAPQLFGPFGDLATWQARGAAVPVGRGGLVCPGGSAGSHGRMYVWRIAVPGGASVEVDTCPSCSGLWLDAGEASRLTAGHLAVPPPAPEVRRRTSDLAPSNETPPAEEKASVGWYLLQLFTEVPVEVYSPKRPLPVVCLALLAACFAVFVVEVLAVTGADARFVVHWGLVPRAVLHGEHPASLVTYMFLHGGIPHLVGNAWFLWTFGCNVESRVGRGRFLWLYLGSGVGGGLLHALLTLTPSLPLIGASGAIAGLMGAYLALFPHAQLYQVVLFRRVKMPASASIGCWAAMNVVFGVVALDPHTRSSGIAWWCHVGGFAVGLLWGQLFGRDFRDGAEVARR